MSGSPTLLTTDEVAERLRQSVDWVYRACARKEFTHTKIGKRVLISEEEVQRYIDTHTQARRCIVKVGTEDTP